MNNVKTGLLLIALTLLLVWFGGLFGGGTGAAIALVIAIAMNVGAYWYSDRVVLRMHKAREVDEASAPDLWRAVAELSQRAGLPMPRVYILPDRGLNAFATGRNPQHAAIAVTEGLLASLGSRELAGVLAHELCHVQHRDILIGTVAATLVGAVSMLGQWAQWSAFFGGMHHDDDGGGAHPLLLIVFGLVAGLGATLIQLAISRSREFQADAGAARLLGDPMPLVGALRKLEFAAERIPMHASQASAHMFIVNPLRGGGFARLFSTHPPIEERVRALESLVGAV